MVRHGWNLFLEFIISSGFVFTVFRYPTTLRPVRYPPLHCQGMLNIKLLHRFFLNFTEFRLNRHGPTPLQPIRRLFYLTSS